MLHTKKITQNIKKFLLDLFCPISCVACNKPDTWFCNSCKKTLLLRSTKIHTLKSPSVFIQKIYYIFPYDTVIIKKLLHLFKYNFIQDIKKPLGDIIARSVQESHIKLPAIIIPIPLHKKRLKWREFNQAEELAREFAQNKNHTQKFIIAPEILVRTRNTKSQMTLRSRYQRSINTQNAFTIVNPEKIRGKDVVLFDDVTTTGSTLHSAANVLKNAGVRSVTVLVLLHQEQKMVH